MTATGPKRPFRIRALERGDFRALLDYDWAPLVRERDTIYLFLAQDHASMGLVAEEGGGKAVGYVVAARSADGRAAFVFQVHVRGDRRGRGIGRALMGQFEAGAAEAGVGRVWLLTGDRAKRFYTQLGYVQSDDLLHPEAAEYLKSVKSASVLVKEIRPPDGLNPGIDAKKRGKDG